MSENRCYKERLEKGLGRGGDGKKRRKVTNTLAGKVGRGLRKAAGKKRNERKKSRESRKKRNGGKGTEKPRRRGTV